LVDGDDPARLMSMIRVPV